MWPLINVFSGGNDTAFPFSLFWHGVAALARFLPWSAPFIFQLLRLLFIFPAVVFLYWLMGKFFTEQPLRRAALIFLLSASGLGVYAMPFILPFFHSNFYFIPMDVWVPEQSMFLTLYHSPHVIFSSVVLMLLLYALYAAFEFRSWRWSALGTLASAILFLFHPFHIPTITAVMGVYVLARILQKHSCWRQLHFLLPAVLVTGAVIWYEWRFLQLHPDLAVMFSQNILPTTVWWVTLVSYGWIFPLAVFGAVRVVRRVGGFFRLQPIWLLAVVWFLAQSAVLYAPVLWQRRLTEGLQFPMAVLAVVGLQVLWRRYVAGWWQKEKTYMYPYAVVFFVFVLFFGMSPVGAIVRDIQLFSRQVDDRYFVPKDFLEAFDWMRQQVSPQSVVLAEPYESQFIAGYTAWLVFAGHDVQTKDWDNKILLVEDFFRSGMTPAQEISFLNRTHIRYIFFDTEKQADFVQRLLRDHADLHIVYQNNRAVILEYRP